MLLPPEFAFSQNSLQTFIDCQRRFELLFIERRRWPAVQVEPVLEHERHMELGARFHQLVYQHKQGLPVEVLTAAISDPDCARWWDNYTKFAPADLPSQQQAEYQLSMPFAGYRLLARFDLLSVDPGRRAVIVDWKTAMKKTPPNILAGRVQTRLYPFILANSLSGSLPPEHISMIYWFPNFPRDAVAFSYDAGKQERDLQFFTDLIGSIVATPAGGFARTDDTRACCFCTYRSLCGRGETAGAFDPMEDEAGEGESLFAGIDLDQIAGIAF